MCVVVLTGTCVFIPLERVGGDTAFYFLFRYLLAGQCLYIIFRRGLLGGVYGIHIFYWGGSIGLYHAFFFKCYYFVFGCVLSFQGMCFFLCFFVYMGFSSVNAMNMYIYPQGHGHRKINNTTNYIGTNNYNKNTTRTKNEKTKNNRTRTTAHR